DTVALTAQIDLHIQTTRVLTTVADHTLSDPKRMRLRYSTSGNQRYDSPAMRATNPRLAPSPPT
ncbi:MAG TPA: hypothetical protein VE242_03515, partial [Chthoniobacterales bacterium]|nr:hypothetical protein [Chthoniobacterales bacterium]